MRRHPISLASGVVSECGPEETVAAALAGGFDAVGLWVEPDKWTRDTTRAVKTALANQIPVLDVEVIWIRPGPDNPDHFRALDIGGELGAANALIVSSDPDPHATTAKFRRLCEHAAPMGIRAALEFMMFTEVKTVHQALAVVRAADHPAAAILVDPIHLSRSRGTIADVAGVPARYFTYAQFCDATAEIPDADDSQALIRDAVDLRLLPGEGVLPLAELLQVLPAAIPLSIELRSKALRDAHPDPHERAGVVARATRAFLAQHAA